MECVGTASLLSAFLIVWMGMGLLGPLVEHNHLGYFLTFHYIIPTYKVRTGMKQES